MWAQPSLLMRQYLFAGQRARMQSWWAGRAASICGSAGGASQATALPKQGWPQAGGTHS